MNILISDPFSKDLPDRLKEFGEVTDDRNEIPNANVMLVRSATKVNREMIDSAKNLKLVIRGGVGVDNIDVEYCKEKGIEVRNTPEASSIAVAELTFAIMLSIQRNIVKAHNSTKNNEWLKKQLKGRELYGKTLGLVGIGRIGTEVAKRAKAFGMNVIATRESEEQSEYAEIVDLGELLEKSDFISFHVPLTEETKGMVNKETIEKMKDGVVIINNARGKVVIENDLAEALKSGKVGYAGIDVYQQEPPEGSPLLSVENILLTPHIGAQTYENMDRIGDIVYEIIKEFAGSQH
ncbi:MAG: D-2-hydroxyacid dehydrogenase [Candidatus Aenigmarchaeota archaeon]|nr:D-2-hydroxyacid dehydrogenase [Candidatus Aenigmarchaeota archaeon]